MHLFVHRSSQTPLWDLHSYTFVYRDGASPPHIIRISPDALAARLASFHAQTQERIVLSHGWAYPSGGPL
jgi:hypothetical protein